MNTTGLFILLGLVGGFRVFEPGHEIELHLVFKIRYGIDIIKLYNTRVNETLSTGTALAVRIDFSAISPPCDRGEE